jgi:hypothetical protein
MATPPCWRCLMNTRTLPQEGFLLLGGSCPTFSSLGGHSPTGSCQPTNCKSPADRIAPKYAIDRRLAAVPAAFEMTQSA